MIYVKNVVILQQLWQSEPKKGSDWSDFMTGPDLFLSDKQITIITNYLLV